MMLVICTYSPESLAGPSLCDHVESHLIYFLINKFVTLKFVKYFHINPKLYYKRKECPEYMKKVFSLNKTLN